MKEGLSHLTRFVVTFTEAMSNVHETWLASMAERG